MKKEKNCSVINSLASTNLPNTKYIKVNRITWRSKFTNVPCMKLKVRMLLTFLSSSPNILYVLLLSRLTSCLVSPRLLISSMLRKDSVVVPCKGGGLLHNVFLNGLDAFAQDVG